MTCSSDIKCFVCCKTFIAFIIHQVYPHGVFVSVCIYMLRKVKIEPIASFICFVTCVKAGSASKDVSKFKSSPHC